MRKVEDNRSMEEIKESPKTLSNQNLLSSDESIDK